MPNDFTSQHPIQDIDESPWDDDTSITSATIPHAEVEWTRLSSDFQNAGYREGITAGKESALQEGFDAGFAQSGAPRGHELGLLRGLANALLLHLSRRSPRVQNTTTTKGSGSGSGSGEGATAAVPVVAVREIVNALASVRFADIAPPPPPEEAEHMHGGTEEEVDVEGKSGEDETQGEAGLGQGPTTIEDVRALRVKLEALLRQAGLKVDLNLRVL